MMTNLKLTGIDEGIEVHISTTLSGADKPETVFKAIIGIFPEFEHPLPKPPQFPSESAIFVEMHGISMATFLKKIREQRILDTAMDHMSKRLENGRTTFEITRQAALVEKVSFPIPGENPLGGVITITLFGEDLGDWIEAATWHRGRIEVPRRIGDDDAMRADGEAITWHRAPE